MLGSDFVGERLPGGQALASARSRSPVRCSISWNSVEGQTNPSDGRADTRFAIGIQVWGMFAQWHEGDFTSSTPLKWRLASALFRMIGQIRILDRLQFGRPER